MLEAPSKEGEGSIPFGLLCASTIAYHYGHNVKLIDLVKEQVGNDALEKVIKEFSPELIGIGGITAGYKNCKELIGVIKKKYNHIPIVIGGVITSVSDLLLQNAGADFIVHGEAEISFPNLIKALEKGDDISKVKGISFLKNGEMYYTESQPQIKNLDDIPMPEYSLIDMDKYLTPADDWVKTYFSHEKNEYEEMVTKLSGKYLFPIITARGCTHKCIFCYRHHVGLRQHSVNYIVRLMKFLHEKYNVGVFQINDELTTVKKKWVLEFCDTLIRENLGIFFIILSARVDNVDEEMIIKLKEAGCLMLNYGYESGSDTILKEIKKGVTRELALKAGLLTKKVGIKNIPEIIIGFPSETEETVEETIDFLKQLDTWPISVNTPIPFPETPLWQYGVDHKLIKDKEEFVLNYKRGFFVNFTKYPDEDVLKFVSKVYFDTKLHWLRNRKKYCLYIKCLFEKFILMNVKPVLPATFYSVLKKAYLKFLPN